MNHPKHPAENESVKEEAAKALQQTKEAAMNKGREMFQEAEHVVKTALNDLTQEIQKLPVWKDTEQSIKKHPMQSMLIVFGLGMIVGMGMRR